MSIHRRQFLCQAAAGLGWMAVSSGCRLTPERSGAKQVITVLGPIAPDQMGVTLPHEHVLVDFIGADQVSPSRYQVDEVFAVALPFLDQAQDLGCQTLVECTPAYLGRDPELLKRLASATRLHLITNTGYYGAGGNKFLPRHAFEESADQLAGRWLAEWRDGIQGSDVRPGFIKVGVDAGKLTDPHRKLVRAAAKTHRDSGLTIAAHTGDGIAALDELATLRQEGVAASALIWVHAQNETKTDLHARAAEHGTWVEFDGVSPKSLARHVELVGTMKRRGLLGRVLLSHDAGWYHVGEPRGGEFRSYDTLFRELIPALQEAEFHLDEIRRVLVENPREAFTIRVRER